jgi:hypothetical protein
MFMLKIESEWEIRKLDEQTADSVPTGTLLEQQLASLVRQHGAERVMHTIARVVPLHVTIEVYGGVADCTAKPDWVTVDIVDHDNEGEG